MTLYRKIAWYMKGLKEYTKTGFENASKSFNMSDLNVDLSNKVFMITGGNSGIGKSCAAQLSKLGATIHIVCRDKDRGEKAVNEIKMQTQNDKIFLHILDLSKPDEVYKFGTQFASSGEKLDVLINNAGCMVSELTYVANNLEVNFATNTLGSYILTESLISTLAQSQEPRVVVVSSGGMLIEKLDLSDINYDKRGHKGFDGITAYAQNKRQQVIMTSEWALKYPTIKFFSMHPGWADTPAVASSMPSFYEKHKSVLRTAEQGSDTITWLAASKDALSQPSGEFFLDRKVVSQHLTLACTRSSKGDNEKLMEILQKHKDHYSAQ